MQAFYLVSAGLHLLATTFWIGGMVFLAMAVVPVVRRPAFQGISPVLLEAIGLRFRILGWIAMGILVLTGLFNLIARGVTLDLLVNPVFWSGPFGQALIGKLTAVSLTILLNALHDFWVGPRATRMLQADPQGAEGKRWRAWASWLARLTLLASLVAMTFGIFMVRGWP